VLDLVRREAWGATPPRGKPVAIAVPVASLFLHHSASPDDGPRSVKAIQKFHMESRGWADIAYSWLYSPKYRMFYEGRGPGIQQAAQKGHNSTAHSVCVLGNWQQSKPPKWVIDDLGEWAEWHGGTWGPDYYRPHLAVSNTICPGQNLTELLDLINNRPEPGPLPATPPQEMTLPPTLRLGDRGDDVRLLQAAVMPHDGVYGAQTEQAVRDYQRRHGLTVDGICGPQTWATILRA